MSVDGWSSASAGEAPRSGTASSSRHRRSTASRGQASSAVHGGAPALLTLHLSQPQPREELEAAFGAPRSIHPDHIGEPVTLLFELDLPDRPFDVALLATDDPGGSRTLTLRRDVRLG